MAFPRSVLNAMRHRAATAPPYRLLGGRSFTTSTSPQYSVKLASASAAAPPSPSVPSTNIPSMKKDVAPSAYLHPAAVPDPLPSAPNSYETSQPTAKAPTTMDSSVDWAISYHGLGTEPFSDRARAILQAPIPVEDVEVKPDGILYLPEIKYRRILNSAFGPGGWGLAPRGELLIGDKVVMREYALVASGRFVAQARGECAYYGAENVSNAIEGCKSNALTRCCKDLGIASELWDPRFLRKFIKGYTKQVDVLTGYGANAKRKRITIRKDDEIVAPYRPAETSGSSYSSAPRAYSSASSAARPAASSMAARPAATASTAATAATARKA